MLARPDADAERTTDEIAQRAQGIGDGCCRIGRMQLVKIDVISVQAA